MEIMILLIGASMLLALFFLIMFIRAGMRGQFRDTYTPSVRILFEDEETENPKINRYE
jgi:cbb3-type cytochrome oxidase maturation protein